MTNISTVEIRNRFADVVNRVAIGQERIIVTRRGKPLVALVPIEEVEFLERAEDRLDLEEALAALKEAKEEGGTRSLEEVMAELGLSPSTETE